MYMWALYMEIYGVYEYSIPHEHISTRLQLFVYYSSGWITNDTVLEIPCFYMQVPVRYMYGVCTLYVRHALVIHTVYVRYMFSLCGMRTSCSFNVRQTFSPRSPGVLCMFGSYSFIVRRQPLGAEEATNVKRMKRTIAE